MIKIFTSVIILAIISITGAMAKDNPNYRNSKEMMEDFKSNFPAGYKVVTDYFQGKICKDDISNVTMEDIKDFTRTYQYGTLIAFESTDLDFYNILITSNKLLNCGNDTTMRKFVDAVNKKTDSNNK